MLCTSGKQYLSFHLRAAFDERLCDYLVGVGKVRSRCRMDPHSVLLTDPA